MRAQVVLLGVIVVVAALASGCMYRPPSPYNRSEFSGVATISKNDVWAVGVSVTNSDYTASRALVEHFDGHSWKVVALPGTAGSGLLSVTAVSATDVWAVGGGRTLHWNGRAWGVTVDPSGRTISNVRSGRGGLVMALSRNNNGGDLQVVTRHANTWQPISAPSLPTTAAPCDGELLISGFTVLTTSDLWLVGGTSKGDNSPTSGCPYAAHWNGSTWTASVPPNPTGDPVGNLNAVSARADGTVWAVGSGYHQDPKTGHQYDRGFAVRWNGSTWQSLCHSGCFTTDFVDIDARGTNVWLIAGDTFVQTASHHMYLDRWAGNGWAAQHIDTVLSEYSGIAPQNFLSSVSVRGGTVAAAGHSEEPGMNPLVDVRDDG